MKFILTALFALAIMGSASLATPIGQAKRNVNTVEGQFLKFKGAARSADTVDTQFMRLKGTRSADTVDTQFMKLKGTVHADTVDTEFFKNSQNIENGNASDLVAKDKEYHKY
ncbi:hypothetical protein NLI96_g10239 [Meripilus lineatus]|uniref:Uncharacterized protein n=1 Tax=Meripilus lineatus TaxID=2056292 RepID=A0AAD5UUA7_9APHY|nr:hypothetical protein NLI96_g10239 [Physisporinus lineatus]